MDSTTLDLLKEQAIDLAIKGQWQKAIELNEKILKEDENDLDAYLRLGFAYLETGNLIKAKKAYLKALKIQPGNQIAINNLEKIKILKKKPPSALHHVKNKRFVLDPNMFLNIPGKTKVVPLVKLGQINILAKLKIGERTFLRIKKRRVEVRNKNNEYIGSLPDDISKRLILFIKAKALYSCYIKEVSKKNVEVFIKEEKKGRRLRRYLSFPKNFQDDLRIMTIETKNEEIGLQENEIEKEEPPLDLEKLAEEVEEKEFYGEPPLEKEEEEFEE